MPELEPLVVFTLALNSKFLNEALPSAPWKRCARPVPTLRTPSSTVKEPGPSSVAFQPERSLPLNVEVPSTGFVGGVGHRETERENSGE